jgi:hypothetical protein
MRHANRLTVEPRVRRPIANRRAHAPHVRRPSTAG